MHLNSRILVASLAMVMAVSAMAQSPTLTPPKQKPLSVEASHRADLQIAELIAIKKTRTPAQRKIDSSLLDTRTMWHGDRISKSVAKLDTGIKPDKDGRVIVDMTANVTPELLGTLTNIGATVVSSYPKYKAIRARMPLDKLEMAAMLAGVKYIAREQVAMTTSGSVTSEGVAAHTADAVQSALGISGYLYYGIGVLSDGVDSHVASETSGDITYPLYIQSGQGGSGDEGTAMCEIINDIAPGTFLGFATAFGGEASFATNITDLFNAGGRILADDVFYYHEPAFQDGIIAQAASQVVTNGGYYFSAAGNEGRLSAGTSGVWEGDYVKDPSNNYHDWSASVINNPMAGSVPVTLQWANPYGASNDDYDLYIVDGAGTIVSSSQGFQTGTQDPYEQASGGSGLYCRVYKFAGNAVFLRLNAVRGYVGYATNGQTWGHSAAPGVISLGASDATLTSGSAFSSASNPETFSSNGPRKIFFDAAGTALTPGNLSSTGGTVRNKPDFVAADGVATSVPGFIPFYGTSAAAPHAAGLASLMLQQNPAMTQADIYNNWVSTCVYQTLAWNVDSAWGIPIALNSARSIAQSQWTGFTINRSLIPTGLNSVVKIQLGWPAPPAGYQFNITAGDNTAVSVPSTVTVPGGNSSVTFIATGIGLGNVSTTITAEMAFVPGLTASIPVDIKKPAITSLTFPSAQLDSAGTMTGTVTISAPAQAGGQKVLLFTDVAGLQVPDKVQVPFGLTTATFSITADVVADKTPVKVTGAANSRQSRAVVTVQPVQITNLIVTPSHVIGGNVGSGTVTIAAPAGVGGLTVLLFSANPAIASVPTTVTILAGNTTATFPITTFSVATPQSIQLTASRPGNGKAVRLVKVDP